MDEAFSSLLTHSSSVLSELGGGFPGRGSAIYTSIPPDIRLIRPIVPASQSGTLAPCTLVWAIMFVETAVVQGVGCSFAGVEASGRIIRGVVCGAYAKV